VPHRPIDLAWTAAALTLLSIPAAAAEPAPTDLAQLDLEALMALRVETVGSASKHEQSVSSAPASVTVVTREEIRDLGYRTLAEVLGGVRGLFVTYDRNYSYLGFRGFQRPGDYNTRILLLIDGHQWSDAVYDMAFIGPEFGVDLDLVERVEVVRGPSSSMYGGNAFFGIVNVVTRRPASVRPGEVAAGAGSSGSYGGRASTAFVTEGGAEGLISVSGADVAGRDLYFPDVVSAPGGGWARGRDWERWGSFLAKSSWQGLSLEVAGVRRDKGVPTGSYGTILDDPHNQTSDRHLFAEARFDWAPASSIDASVRGYYDQYDFHEWYAYAGAAPGDPATINADDDRGRTFGAEARAVARLGSGWVAVAGAETKVLLLQLRNYDLTGPANLLDRRRTAAASLYAQVEAQLTPWVQVVAGARYDHVGVFAEEVSPRFAVILTPLEGTALKALYGRAFRPPNDAEQHYQDGFSWKPPSGLHPERIATAELVLEQRLGGGFQVGAAAYRYTVDGLISTVVDPADGMITYANTSSARAVGLELEAAYRGADGLGARASWALQRAEDLATGARLTDSPASLAKLQLHGPLGLAGLRGGAEMLYMSSRATIAGSTTPAHLLVNLNLVLAGLVSGSLDLSLGVRNALGASYGDPGADSMDVIPQDGRSVRASATWRF
jgi:iron complex outermembrane receptor protein